MPPIVIPQAAAVPVRADGRLLMVTSRNRRRWVFPKGKIEATQTAPEAARAEAWEEAGLLGEVDARPLGTYRYGKVGRDHAVAVFVMRVTGEGDDWPEKGERDREWVSVIEALDRIAEPGLRRIVREAAESGRLAGAVEAA